MGKSAKGVKNYPVQVDYLAGLVRQIEKAGLRVSLKSENRDGNSIWFRILHGFSAASYGEKITVTLTPYAGGTTVTVHSECGMPTQIVDMGKNQDNVDAIFRFIESGLQAANTPQPRPAAKAANFCPQCGKPVTPDAHFCSVCGAKLG